MDDCDLGEAAVVELVTKLVAGVGAGGKSSGAIGRLVLLLWLNSIIIVRTDKYKMLVLR